MSGRWSVYHDHFPCECHYVGMTGVGVRARYEAGYHGNPRLQRHFEALAVGDNLAQSVETYHSEPEARQREAELIGLLADMGVPLLNTQHVPPGYDVPCILTALRRVHGPGWANRWQVVERKQPVLSY